MRLIEDLQVPPEHVVVAGDSAGGGLCLALLLYLRDNEYTLPGGAILFSPWVGEQLTDVLIFLDININIYGPDPELCILGNKCSI